MSKPLFVAPLAPERRQARRAGLRSKDAFTVRRCQAVLASAQGLKPGRIAVRLGCSAGTARNAVRAWSAEGVACRREKSSRPTSAKPVLGPERDADLRALVHQGPRAF